MAALAVTGDGELSALVRRTATWRYIRVGNVDVVQLEIGGLDTERSSFIVAEATRLGQTMRDGHLVASVGGGIRRVAVDGQLRAAGRDEDLFVVSARVDEDTLSGA